MSVGRLSELQARILRVLAGIRPRWTLTGGGALASFHTKHRETRDLDLFWRGESGLGDLPRAVTELLKSDGLGVEPVQSSPAFHRLRVTGAGETVLVDLVAEPVPAVEEPGEFGIGGATILVDTPHEPLVAKLCTLLERSELRDLVDVEVLLNGGGNLEQALGQAPSKDAGFSPLTLAWVLGQLPILALAGASGLSKVETAHLEGFRDELIGGSLPSPDRLIPLSNSRGTPSSLGASGFPPS